MQEPDFFWVLPYFSFCAFCAFLWLKLGTTFARARREMKLPSPSQLSRELREDDTPELRARRTLFSLSLVGTVAAQIVALYQVGIVKRLPDLPFAPFNSNRVNASDYAYKRFQVPDAFLMLASYSTTALLAGMGGKERYKTQKWLPILTFAKVVLDVLTAIELGREEWKDNKALCAYCQGATVVSLISLWVAWPEAKRAWRGE